MSDLPSVVIEIFGILAGVLVLVSFLMKGEMKIRIINIFGASIFIVYGVLLGSVSVTLLNVGLVLVHIVKIAQMRKNKGDL